MASLIEIIQILAWPVTVLILVCMFRQQLKGLLDHLKNFEAAGIKAQFENRLEDATAIAELVPRVVRPSFTINSEKEQTGTVAQPSAIVLPDIDVRFHKLADSSPARAVIEAWAFVERAGRDSTKQLDLNEGLINSPVHFASLMRQQGYFDAAQDKIFLELFQMRNLAIHGGDRAVEPEQARTYITLALNMIEHLKTMHKR